MLDTLFSSIIPDSLTPGSMLSALFTSLALGFAISLFYRKTRGNEEEASGFAVTLIMLPAIIAVIIMLVGNNVARAFSLAGAFSLIRFRSAPGDPKDISYVFFSLGVGLACGMGYVAYAVVFAVVLCGVMAVLHKTRFAQPQSIGMQLKISVPEDMNFQGAFDGILSRYTDFWRLKRVKTSDFGTLFEISYMVKLKPSVNPKQMIDELRCKNGNLNISLTLKEYEEKNYA